MFRENIRKSELNKFSWTQLIDWLQHQKIIQPFVLIICSILSLIPNLPKFTPVPLRDSGVFLYFGDQILKGQLPYRDLWDHKPPAVFYTDALGLWLGNGSRIGVWTLEVLSVAATGLFAYYFLKKYFEKWPAMFASMIAVANLTFVMRRGNFTEEFTLPFQYFALFIFSFTYRRKSSNWLYLLIGISAGIAFMYKQTMIGIWIVIFIMLIIRAIIEKDWTGLFRRLFLIGTGAGFIFLMVALYFAYFDQFNVFWNAAFRFNLFYTRVSLPERILKLNHIWTYFLVFSPYYTLSIFLWANSSVYLLLHWVSIHLNKTYTFNQQYIIIISIFIAGGSFLSLLFFTEQIVQFVFIGFFAGLVFSVVLSILQYKQIIPKLIPLAKYPLDKKYIFPLQIGVIGFPIEILLISVSARYYEHYYMGLILPLSIFVAFLLSLTSTIEKKLISRFCYGILLLTLGFYAGYKINQMMVIEQNKQAADTVEYILDHSDDDDFVLVWGAQTVLNYLSQREAPTRFVYTIPLYTQGYVTNELVNELYMDLVTNSPKLIIDVKSPDTPFITYSETGECLLPQSDFHESMQEIFIYVCENYHLKKTFGKEEWSVYEHNGK